jgi:UDP-N-acetylmuramate dehydrogenase
VNGFADAIGGRFGARVERDAPLASLTTFKVGGAADYLLSTDTTDDLADAVRIAHEHGVPVTLLGGGSNLLIADAGIRGLVVRVHRGEVHRISDEAIRADAGLTINGLVRWTITHGLAGLEAWAGTPGTVGGAIYGNAHFRGRNISEYVLQVQVMDRRGDVRDVPAGEMEFAYDYSRLHRTREIVVAADFRVGRGETDTLRAIARDSLAYRKRTQPLALPSAGCIFQNPDPARDTVPADIPCSAGALVDRAGLKGARTGGARVSPTHANFIVNDGGATAADIRALIDRCKRDVRERFGVSLREEIVALGFDEQKEDEMSARRIDGNTTD